VIQREQNPHAACLNNEGIINHTVRMLVYQIIGTGENKERIQMITTNTTKLQFTTNTTKLRNTCMVADDPVVLFVFTTVCKGGVYLPVIVIDLRKVTLKI
jgi:hypothetical protein